MSDQSADVERLRSRLERERKARRQAELIAERGMRELWETNRELQARVARRIAEVERVGTALEYAHVARLHAIAEVVDDLASVVTSVDTSDVESATVLLDQARSLTAVQVPAPLAPTDCSIVELLDRILERWQKAAAKEGQLLSVVEGESVDDESIGHWPELLAAADTLAGGVVRSGGPGSLSIEVAATVDRAWLKVSGTSLAAALDRDGGRPTALATELLVASRIAAAVGGELQRDLDAAEPVLTVWVPHRGAA